VLTLPKEDKKETESFLCPLLGGNPDPVICPFAKTIWEDHEAISFLKKGYWIQALIGIGTFLSVLGVILKLSLGI